MAASLYREGARVLGETYPVRDSLRASGGQWDGASKSWVYASEDAAQRAIDSAQSAPKRECGCYVVVRYGRIDTSRSRIDRSCRRHRCPACGGAKSPRYETCYDCHDEERMGY